MPRIPPTNPLLPLEDRKAATNPIGWRRANFSLQRVLEQATGRLRSRHDKHAIYQSGQYFIGYRLGYPQR